MMQDDTQDAAATMRAAALNATAQQGPAALEQAHGYRRADDGSVVINETDALSLHALIFERVLCRRDRAFQRADDLRKQLREAGVAVNDTENTYRILLRAPTTHDYQRVDDGTVQMTVEDQAQLDDLLFQRMTAKRSGTTTPPIRSRRFCGLRVFSSMTALEPMKFGRRDLLEKSRRRTITEGKMMVLWSSTRRSRRSSTTYYFSA